MQMNSMNEDGIVSRETYERFIVARYDFIPKEHKQHWVCVSKKGENPRKSFWESKQMQLIDSGQLPKESKLVNVARFIHPTKKHICGKCEMACSIYYEYPTVHTWKWLKKTFDYDKDSLTIFEIYASLTSITKKKCFEKYFGMSMADLETQCRSDTYSGSKLSPGVMSNAPDRLDGFHCYNSVCGCRVQHDKGRSSENMKSYIRDRRAYELFSDGNCLLANAVMGNLNTVTSTCFICGKSELMTADHIGPISLGFIHDPVNFQACCTRCNSSKNNRITEKDVAKIKSMEEKGTYLLSWWARDAWEKNKDKSMKTLKDNLNKNTKKFLSVVLWLKLNKLDILKGFTEIYLNHEKSYTIRNLQIMLGDITYECKESVTGKKTKQTQKERTEQILLEINEKKNTKTKISLSEKEIAYMKDITLDNFKHTICTVLGKV
jgi:Alw26I/Eco31I/Esp3I family type II restriction endonuclease